MPSFAIGVQLTEQDIMVSVIDDDDRVYWYHLMLFDTKEKLVVFVMLCFCP